MQFIDQMKVEIENTQSSYQEAAYSVASQQCSSLAIDLATNGIEYLNEFIQF